MTLSCRWFHAISLATETGSFVDAPHNLDLSLFLHPTNIPIGQWWSSSHCFGTKGHYPISQTRRGDNKECLKPTGQKVTFEKPNCLHMCDAELLFFGRIGRLRKQHEQIGEIKRQTWHYIYISLSLSPSPSQEIMTLYQASPIISKLGKIVSLGISQHHLWLLEMVPETQRCEWCWISIIHHKIKIWIHLNTTSFIGRENIRKQHQHRARPSDMHIPRNTPGPRLHQRQSEARAVVASHHGLGSRVLPMKGPNGIRVLQRHFWVLFGACSLHSCWTCLTCIAEELAIKCLWRTQISKIIGKNTHVQPMWMCGWMTDLDFRTHACINACLHMYICEDESI